MDLDALHNLVVEALEAGDDARLREVLAEVRTADIAEVFDLLGDAERSHILIDILSSHKAAEIVILLDEAVRGDVVDDLDSESLTELVAELPPDDAADVLGELTDKESHEILEQIPDAISDRIEELLVYDEETAGGIMNTDVVSVAFDKTVKDAVEHIRQAAPEEELHRVYIVDGDQRLVGVVPLRHLVINPPQTRLEDICDRNPVYVNVGDDQETVVQIIRRYDVPTAAVIDENHRLIGRITHDDLLDVADEEAEEDMLRLAGTDPSELDTSSVFRAARIRLTWLLPCMCGTLGTAMVMMLASAEFDERLFAVLAMFVPMIGAMAGNAGIQTSTIIVRGFAIGELIGTKLSRVLLREGRIAITMAPICAAVAWVLVSLILPVFKEALTAGTDPSHVALAVGISMGCTVLTAALLGIAFPFTFRRCGVDPAIASGPLVTTFNDIISVSIYLTLAMAIAR